MNEKPMFSFQNITGKMINDFKVISEYGFEVELKFLEKIALLRMGEKERKIAVERILRIANKEYLESRA